MAHFKRGDYKVVCDQSGMIVNASECKMQWNGLFVHRDFWEPRQPQDNLPSSHDRQAVPNPRPEGALQFISATDVTAEDL